MQHCMSWGLGRILWCDELVSSLDNEEQDTKMLNAYSVSVFNSTLVTTPQSTASS